MPLEALADRGVRALGHEKTVGTGWAGAGSFRELLRRSLPEDIRLTAEPPYLVYDAKRARRRRDGAAHRDAWSRASSRAPTGRAAAGADRRARRRCQPERRRRSSVAAARACHAQAEARRRDRSAVRWPRRSPKPSRASRGSSASSPPLRHAVGRPASAAIQQSIARIQEACQAPPLAPQEYRALFEVMAQEINDNDLVGAQTLANITKRAQERGLELRRDDVRFVLEVVSEADPWFEQGASANLFAGRFRNFVVARCRGQGLNLSADELDLIDAWFAGGTLPQPHGGGQRLPHRRRRQAPPPSAAGTVRSVGAGPGSSIRRARDRWWSYDDGRPSSLRSRHAPRPHRPRTAQGDEFPRIIRTRLRG